MRAACQGVVANEVDTVADTVERPSRPQAFLHHTGNSLHGQLRYQYLHNVYYPSWELLAQNRNDTPLLDNDDTLKCLPVGQRLHGTQGRTWATRGCPRGVKRPRSSRLPSDGLDILAAAPQIRRVSCNV